MVGGLGASTYDIAAAGDHDRNFYLWGAMGGAVMIGLGVALAQPKLKLHAFYVVCFDFSHKTPP